MGRIGFLGFRIFGVWILGIRFLRIPFLGITRFRRFVGRLVFVRTTFFGGVAFRILGLEIFLGITELLFQISLVVRSRFSVLTRLRATSCCALDIFDSANIFQDIFEAFAFVLEAGRTVLALQEFEKLFQIFPAGFLLGDRAGELAFGQQVPCLKQSLLGGELLAHLSRLHQQASSRWIGGRFELAHADEEFLELGILGRQLFLLLLEFFARIGRLAISRFGISRWCVLGEGQYVCKEEHRKGERREREYRRQREQ